MKWQRLNQLKNKVREYGLFIIKGGEMRVLYNKRRFKFRREVKEKSIGINVFTYLGRLGMYAWQTHLEQQQLAAAAVCWRECFSRAKWLPRITEQEGEEQDEETMRRRGKKRALVRETEGNMQRDREECAIEGGGRERCL